MNKARRKRLCPVAAATGLAILLGAGVPAFLLGSADARAQQATESGRIEQIVVTARRREESLQDVPVSITAFSSDALERNMFEGIADYLSRSPNVSFISTGSRDRKELSIRGVTNQLDSAEALVPSGTFGFYIDGFNVSSATRNPAVMDLERIEVLRGPQGTYFGRNAIGGAINITTKKPEQAWFGQIGADFSRFSTYDLEIIGNAPLVEDKLAARLALKYHESDGHIENIHPIGGGNDSLYKYGRLSIRYTPTDRLTVDVIGAYSDEVVGMREGVPSGVMSMFAAGLYGPLADPDGIGFFPENTDRVNFNREQEVGADYRYITANVEYVFDDFVLTSITGYLDSKMFLLGDVDGGSRDYFYETKPIFRDSTSQEIRLQSEVGGALDWTVGGIVSRDRGSIAQKTFAGDAGIFGLPSGFQITGTFGDSETLSSAVFGELLWHAADRLDVLFGLRYTHEEIEISQYNVSSGVINNFVADETTFDDVSPKVSVSYDLTDDTRVYGTVAKGFKAGGVQIGTQLEESSYAPEELWNYEIGVKSEFFDGRARLNAAAFYADWKDLQAAFAVARTDPDGTIIWNSGIQNAASAGNLGAEAELTALLTDDLIVSFGAGYIDAQFDDFPNAFVNGKGRDLSERRIPNAPEWTLNGDAEYGFRLADRDAYVRLEWYYRDEIRSNLQSLVREDEGFPFVVPSYHHVNLRAGIDSERFSIAAYVENLFDEVYYTNAYQKAFVGGLHLQPSYQTWGVRVTVRTD